MTQDKPVHVDAYTKDDGTKVREHYRGLPNGMSPDPEGGSNQAGHTRGLNISDFLNEKLADAPAAVRLVGRVAQNALPLGRIFKEDDKMYNYQMKRVWHCRNELQNASRRAAHKAAHALEKMNKAKYNDCYKLMQQSQIELHKVQKILIKELGDCNKQQEYEKLYKDFVKNEGFIRSADLIFKDVENAYYDGRYSDMQGYIEEYHQRTQLREKYYQDLTDWKRNIGAFSPSCQTVGVTNKLQSINKNNQINDAYEMWIIASEHFKKSVDYLAPNGVQLDSAAFVPSKKLQSVVSKKVKEQIKVDDAPGIYLHSQSSLAKDISRNEFFRKYISQYKNELSQGKKVDFSVPFGQSGSENLRLALGNADVVDMHIDDKGYLRCFVVDTYDFNDDDRNYKVEIARNIQDHGLLTNYFVIVSINIPIEELNPYLE